MKTQVRAKASALNREIIDDRDDRLSIHTHEIRLTQAHLPYKVTAGQRRSSTRHFAVFADRIVLGGVLQNPGRDIELHAREIVVERPTTLDAAGGHADKDFPPGDAVIQKDAKPGAAGTDGADATSGGDGGTIVIDALRVVTNTASASPLSIVDVAALGARVFASHPQKIDNTVKLAPFEIARTKMYGPNEVSITLEEAHIEGLAGIALSTSYVEGDRIGMRFELSALTIAGKAQMIGNAASQPFACTIDASAAIDAAGKVSAPTCEVSLIAQTPIRVANPFGPGLLVAALLKTIREEIDTHLRASAVEPAMAAFGARLRSAALTLLAGGARGGRGQDGHAGLRGDAGSDGATTLKSGRGVGNGGYGFPEEAIGKDGSQGGRAGAPGRSGDGGNGGRIALNIVEPLALDLLFGVAGGDGGPQASAGDRGPGGHGGSGSICKMYDAQTGRPIDEMRATDGRDGALGVAASGSGSQGQPGIAGTPLQFNGQPFNANAIAVLPLGTLALSLSLSQLLITQNATDLDFLNASNEAELVSVAGSYAWLVGINQTFAQPDAAIGANRVSLAEGKVRGGLHNSAIVSLMRLQQGLDYFGHSDNWTPILNLNNLVTRTGQLIQLGKVVEDQYNRYLDKGATDKERMQAFRQAKQAIDRKLGDFMAEIDKLKPQIDSFQSEVEDYSEDLRRQRTRLVEGQLDFTYELVKHLRAESGLELDLFLDMLGTVIGCVGGVVGAVGGIKTAIDAVKKAEALSKQVKGVVAIFKKAKATIDNIAKAYSSVKDYIDATHPNAAKILVDAGEFDAMLKEYLGKFDAAGALRRAMDYYIELAQARNMAAYNYSTLVAQLLDVRMQHDQLASSIGHIDAEMAAHQDNVLPIYTAYLKDAYEDVQRTLLRNIYQENRAYQYWALRDRQVEANDLNIATQAARHERLIADIDSFRENNEAFSPFHQKVVVASERYPNEFAAMRKSKSLAFALDIRGEPGFQNLRYVIARKFRLEFPDIAAGAKVLVVNLIHSGQAVLNSDVNLDKAGALHAFSHRPRTLLYKIDYQDPNNTAGGNLGEGDQGYIGLSPFTQWRLDFDLKGNEWLDLNSIQSVVITFEGRTLGPGRKLN